MSASFGKSSAKAAQPVPVIDGAFRRDRGQIKEVKSADFLDGARDERAVSKLCTGRSGCLVNALCCSCVLCFHAFSIYCVGCTTECAGRMLDGIFCFLCRVFCWCWFVYTDRTFPAEPKSIGAWQGKPESQIRREIVWKRAAEVVKGTQRIKLFEDGIDIKDVAQGGLGDCWLISALCCLAENPGQLYKCFTTAAYNDRGKYTVRLFDGRDQRWKKVTVDDQFPVEARTGRLLFAQVPHESRPPPPALLLTSRPHLPHALRAAAWARALGDPDREGLRQVLRLLRGAGRRARALGLRGTDGRPGLRTQPGPRLGQVGAARPGAPAATPDPNPSQPYNLCAWTPGT